MAIPDPDLVYEAAEFLDVVAGQAIEGGEITLSVTIPKQDLLLMAWIGHKQDMARRGRIEMLGRDIDLSPRGADFRRAAEYVRDVVRRHCRREFEKLSTGDETLVTQPRTGVVVQLREPMPT